MTIILLVCACFCAYADVIRMLPNICEHFNSPTACIVQPFSQCQNNASKTINFIDVALSFLLYFACCHFEFVHYFKHKAIIYGWISCAQLVSVKIKKTHTETADKPCINTPSKQTNNKNNNNNQEINGCKTKLNLWANRLMTSSGAFATALFSFGWLVGCLAHWTPIVLEICFSMEANTIHSKSNYYVLKYSEWRSTNEKGHRCVWLSLFVNVTESIMIF